jgi:hypothetical protein
MGRAAETIEMAGNLKWNKLLPAVSGFYWLAEAGMQPHIVQVFVDSGSHKKIKVMLPGDEKKYPVDVWPGALWCGPLKSPE